MQSGRVRRMTGNKVHRHPERRHLREQRLGETAWKIGGESMEETKELYSSGTEKSILGCMFLDRAAAEMGRNTLKQRILYTHVSCDI